MLIYMNIIEHMKAVIIGMNVQYKVQSTLVISNSKRLSEILRDIRILTYQI